MAPFEAPTHYYHGTDALSLERVLREGLRRYAPHRTWPKLSEPGSLFVTTNWRSAYTWAQSRTWFMTELLCKRAESPRCMCGYHGALKPVDEAAKVALLKRCAPAVVRFPAASLPPEAALIPDVKGSSSLLNLDAWRITGCDLPPHALEVVLNRQGRPLPEVDAQADVPLARVLVPIEMR